MFNKYEFTEAQFLDVDGALDFKKFETNVCTSTLSFCDDFLTIQRKQNKKGIKSVH